MFNCRFWCLDGQRLTYVGECFAQLVDSEECPGLSSLFESEWSLMGTALNRAFIFIVR